MTDLPTLEAALKLADQDSPLPSLAGPALKVLRAALQTAMLRPESVVAGRIINTLSNSRRGFHLEISADMSFFVGQEVWITKQPPASSDSATLTTLIAEFRGREAVGRAKYGTDVDRTDLNNAQWRQHLREELMDALLYSLAEERTAPMEVVECGGCAPAVATSPVYGIDLGVDDRTVEVFGERATNGVVTFTQFLESEPAGPNSGHGHVRARPDGLVAKCGGPMLCRICAKELADMLGIPGDDKCWCSTCRPITLTDMRMVLCPTCGNKRCPRANDHRNACTGSNAVGQPGSSWEHVKPITSADGLRPIESAPVDGTPVLVKVRPVEFLPDRAARWAGIFFVARNRGDGMEWGFAAPVGHGGFPRRWLAGWMPLPAPEDC